MFNQIYVRNIDVNAKSPQINPNLSIANILGYSEACHQLRNFPCQTSLAISRAIDLRFVEKSMKKKMAKIASHFSSRSDVDV